MATDEERWRRQEERLDRQAKETRHLLPLGDLPKTHRLAVCEDFWCGYWVYYKFPNGYGASLVTIGCEYDFEGYGPYWEIMPKDHWGEWLMDGPVVEYLSRGPASKMTRLLKQMEELPPEVE